MASTQAKAERKATALGRISSGLGIEQADLHAQGRGDPEMALVVTLERIADALEAKTETATAKETPTPDAPKTPAGAVGSITTETVRTTALDTLDAPAVPKRAVKRS